MVRRFLQDVSQRGTRVSLFLFFTLLFLSVAFYVMADDAVSTNKNIFQDSDQDGLSNDEEALYRTDPLNKDTDGDGYMDGVEVESGYDPTKAAPGDKLVPDAADRKDAGTLIQSEGTTLTDQVSQKVVSMVQDTTTGDMKDVSIDDINASVQSIMSQTDQEIVLPEVDVNAIKTKKVSSKLKGNAKIAQEKDDAVQYLTVMAYILANNSPKKFHSEGDLSSMLLSFGSESLSAITLGNNLYLEDLAKSGKKILDETKDIEVPEGMLDVHTKALSLARYSMQLKDELKTKDAEDPLGKIATLSKAQGFLGAALDFSKEVHRKLNDYGIQNIPLSM